MVLLMNDREVQHKPMIDELQWVSVTLGKANMHCWWLLVGRVPASTAALQCWRKEPTARQ
jgi:hypothetical protein